MDNNKKPMNKARPTVSVVEEEERSVELVPAEICHGQVLKVPLGLLLSDIRLLPLLW